MLSRIDPYAREVTNSVGNGIVLDPAHDWRRRLPDAGLERAGDLRDARRHLQPPDEETAGTFADAIEKLDHLKRLGVNAMQVMPAAEFAGDFSWGYNPARIFAVESTYGGPTGFKRFVKAAHRGGIAVILDVVYNHFGPSDLDLWQFDGWSENDKGGIYFYNDWRSETPWGDTRPDYGRSEVRQFIRDNALMWLEEYHVDGLRFDMTLYIRNVRGDEGDPGERCPTAGACSSGSIARSPSAIPDGSRSPRTCRTTPDHGADRGGRSGFQRPMGLAVRASRPRGAHHAERRATAHGDGRARARPIATTATRSSASSTASRTTRWPTARPASLRKSLRDDPGSWFAQKRSTLAPRWCSPRRASRCCSRDRSSWKTAGSRIRCRSTGTRREFSGIVRMYRDLIHLRLNRGGSTRGLTGHGITVHRIDEADNVIAFHRWHQGGPGDDVVVVANFATTPAGTTSSASRGRGTGGCGSTATGTATARISASSTTMMSWWRLSKATGCYGLPRLSSAPIGALIFSQDD